MKIDKLDKFYSDLGSVIKQHRKSKGLSMEQLGFEIGLGKADIHSIEKGKNVTILTLLKISIILDVSIIDLLNFKHHITISDVDRLIKEKKG